MVRVTKYEDTIYEKVEFSGKILMYCSSSWNVLFPIVDIIRGLKKNTIIAHVYCKGQQTISMYGRQYNHCVLGYDFKKKSDYIENLKAVKNIFIFSDESDRMATNLMNAAKKNKINVICYSNLDTVYHFYNNTFNGEKITLKTPVEVLDQMYNLIDLESAKKYADLFDDFEIIEESEIKSSTLNDCIQKIKKIDLEEKQKKVSSKLFDPHLNKLKKMEYERSQKNIVYPDSVENLNKKVISTQKTLLSRFFAKPN